MYPGFTRQPLVEPDRMVENPNLRWKDSPNAGLELVTQRATSAHATSEVQQIDAADAALNILELIDALETC